MSCLFYLQFSSAVEWIRRQLIHSLRWGTLLLKHRYYRRGTGPTLRHKSNYENKPAQLSQLRTLHNASFDKCLEVRVALNCGWADDKQIWLFLQNGEEGWEEWARVAHKGVIPVMWPKQSELTRPCSYAQLDFFFFSFFFLLTWDESGTTWSKRARQEMRSEPRSGSRVFNNSYCYKTDI